MYRCVRRVKRFNRDVEYSGTISTSRPEGTSWSWKDGGVGRMKAYSWTAAITARTQLRGRTRRRKESPDLSSPSPHTLQPLADASYCLNQLEARGQESLHSTIYQDSPPGTKSKQRRVDNKSGEGEWGKQRITSPALKYLTHWWLIAAKV